MKPTTIGGQHFVATMTREPAQAISQVVEATTQALTVRPVNTGAITVSAMQLPLVEQRLAELDFATMPSADIIQIGMKSEKGLNETLDGFLAKLDKHTASNVFILFDRLQKGVDDANLPEVLKKIEEGDKPGMLAKIGGYLRGRKPADVAHDAYEEVRGLLAGKTKNLSDVMAGMEHELQVEMQQLFTKLGSLEQLKAAYREHFGEFAVDAAVSQAFLVQAKMDVEAEAVLVAQNPDALAQARLEELQAKLQLLESRTLALEATYTRLPADSMVIQQIQGAGVVTLQETATTAASRFASIKMTLLAVNGALAVKGVQQLSEKQAKLDGQLALIRGQVTKDIVSTAVTAPGKNRLAHAMQIEKIIADTQEVRQLIADGRKVTEQNFAEARLKFEAARRTLSTNS